MYSTDKYFCLGLAPLQFGEYRRGPALTSINGVDIGITEHIFFIISHLRLYETIPGQLTFIVN